MLAYPTSTDDCPEIILGYFLGTTSAPKTFNAAWHLAGYAAGIGFPHTDSVSAALECPDCVVLSDDELKSCLEDMKEGKVRGFDWKSLAKTLIMLALKLLV